MIKIQLVRGRRRFQDPGANPALKLTRYRPDGEVEEITPRIQWAIDNGILTCVDQKEAPVPAEEFPEGSKRWRAEDGTFTDEKHDADGVPEIVKKKVTRPKSTKQCKAKTKAGKRCRNKALKHAVNCKAHISEKDLAKVDKKLSKEA